MKVTYKYTGTTLLSLVAIATFFVSLPAIASYAQEFPAIDPPTAEKVLESKGVKETKQAEIPPLSATTEWLYHKTADGKHPNGIEQRQLWFINRARSDPTVEGIWLATESHTDVSNGRNYFGVDVAKLQDEFAAIIPMPPAAFDRRLYEAARVHSEDLISRDAQDHNNQLDRVTAAGFSWLSFGGVVFSYTRSGLHAHAAFNIDWGNEADGMQTGRGHRVALMSDDQEYTNVGIASIYVTDAGKSVGPFVTTGNYAKAKGSAENHFNAFIVGTVWTDSNSNGWYDDGEGLSGVTIMPSIGTYYAITADSSGYAIPITETGAITLNFSGGNIPASGSISTTLSAGSQLVDYISSDVASFTVTPSAGANGSISPATPQTVYHGTTTSFILNPDIGYQVSSVTGCGGTLSDNTFSTAPVTADCTVTAHFTINTSAVCGDGIVTAPEACDDGNIDNTDGCLDSCVNASCGDGYLYAGVEACDDGNTGDGDSCSATCTIENGSFFWPIFHPAFTGGQQ